MSYFFAQNTKGVKRYAEKQFKAGVAKMCPGRSGSRIMVKEAIKIAVKGKE